MIASADAGTLIPPTFNPALERALADKLERIAGPGGAYGVLEPLAILLGLIQNSLVPTLTTPTLALVVADQGFAIAQRSGASHTGDTLAALRHDRLPMATLARIHEVTIDVIHARGDEGRAAATDDARDALVRTTADARLGAAMTGAQAHAALRFGMRAGEGASGTCLACAGLGAGSRAGAAAVIGALTQREPAEFMADFGESRAVLASVRERHATLWKTGAGRDPVEVLAALGGLEVASMSGLMLGAAARRRLVLVDGLAAIAALQVATRIAPYVADYCIPVRSHGGLLAALALCRPALPSPTDLDTMEGTAGVLAAPLLRSAAALLATRFA